MYEIIVSWKAWHRELSDVLGCEVLERSVTLDAVKNLQSELTAARDEAERLRGRVSELESERGKLPYDVVISGGMTFRKGVAIKTFVKAAQRWHRQAMDRYKTIDVKRLRQQASELDP